MAKTLPTRPRLEQLKKQAKELLKSYKANDGETLALARTHVPRLAEKSDAEIAQERFVLQDAQYVIAREYGFATWDALAAAIKPSRAMMRSPDSSSIWVRRRGAKAFWHWRNRAMPWPTTI